MILLIVINKQKLLNSIHIYLFLLVYYRQLSDKIKNEILDPILSENFPINKKLTDDLSGIISEDHYNWLKYLAKNGVKEAQNSLAGLLFWGLNGIKRNLKASAELFNLAAQNNDPESMYNYGISLLSVKLFFKIIKSFMLIYWLKKGSSGQKNITEAIKKFEDAAKLVSFY